MAESHVESSGHCYLGSILDRFYQYLFCRETAYVVLQIQLKCGNDILMAHHECNRLELSIIRCAITLERKASRVFTTEFLRPFLKHTVHCYSLHLRIFIP